MIRRRTLACSALAYPAVARTMASAAPTAARAQPTLVQLLAAGDHAAIVDSLAILGRTLDLASLADVHAAIGNVDGLPARRSRSDAFVAYTAPLGEIIYNPSVDNAHKLLVRTHRCMSLEMVLDRICPPAFLGPSSVVTVLQSTYLGYADLPGKAFTYTANTGLCAGAIGIAQRRNAA